jgi:hypothetical protein
VPDEEADEEVLHGGDPAPVEPEALRDVLEGDRDVLGAGALGAGRAGVSAHASDLLGQAVAEAVEHHQPPTRARRADAHGSEVDPVRLAAEEEDVL